MEKIVVRDEAGSREARYAHLEGVIDFLLESGNSLAHSYRWGSNREGYCCYLSRPIDFNGLDSVFYFPDTIVLGRSRNVIYCERTGCIIQTLE